MDEECDNICRLSCFVVSRVLTDWQVALLYVRTYPWAAHVMVRVLAGFDTPAHVHSLHNRSEHERPSYCIWGSIKGTAAKTYAARMPDIWPENCLINWKAPLSGHAVQGVIETVVNEDLQEEPEPLQREMSGGDMNVDDTV